MDEKSAHCAVPGAQLKDTGFYFTLSIIGGKYKMTIMHLLSEYKVLRHNQIHRFIETISFKTLNVMLKELVADGVVERKEYPQIPPKVEYSLTEKGRSLMPILHAMCDWGEQNQHWQLKD